MEFTQDIFAEQMKPITGSAIRQIFHLLAKPGMISFAGGNPSADALDVETVAELAQEALSTKGKAILQYGATEGWAPLRESIAEFVKTAGIETTPAEILPVHGSSQAFDLLLKAVINPGDTILAESPTFLGALQAMRIYGANIVSLPMDENGVIPEAAEEAIKKHHPKMMYIIPTFQNPTGVTLSLERRKAMAELANKYGVILAEDDPYRDLRYSGDPLPAIKSFDTDGWVVYMTSFSKLIAPGMRVGAAIANPTLLRKIVIGKQSADTHTTALTQAIVDLYIRKGLLLPHIERINKAYKCQLDAMLDSFKYFPENVTHTVPQGGLFVWASLPEGANALELFERAVENNVAFVPGTHFYADGGNLNTFRLNFSNSPVDVIETGMKKLGGLI